MKRNTAWVVSMVVGLGAAACGGANTPRNPLESPVGEIQTAGAPRTIVRAVDDPNRSHWINDIAISGDDLYVTSAWDGVYRLPKFGGGITALEEGTGNTEFFELATGDGAVFWEEASFGKGDAATTRVRRVGAGDVAVSTIYQAALGSVGTNSTRDFQVDTSVAYITEADANDAGAVHRIPTSGGAELSSILPFMLPVNGGTFNPTDMPTASWIAHNGAVFMAHCPGDGSCAVLRVTGDSTQTIATFPGDEAYVRAVDDANIYVSNRFHVPPPPSGTIPPMPLLKVDQQTGDVVQLTPDGSDAWYMVADDQELFFAAFQTGITINAISKQGGDPRIVADLTDLHGIWAIAQDDTYLFVLTPDGDVPLTSAVIAVPKHPPAP